MFETMHRCEYDHALSPHDSSLLLSFIKNGVPYTEPSLATVMGCISQIVHWCLVTPYDDSDLGQISSGNGLLPDGTKPLPESMLTYHP